MPINALDTRHSEYWKWFKSLVSFFPFHSIRGVFPHSRKLRFLVNSFRTQPMSKYLNTNPTAMICIISQWQQQQQQPQQQNLLYYIIIYKPTVSIPDWRLQMQGTYSINFDLNVNKCLPASIRETPWALNSYRCHSYKSKHVENILQAFALTDLVSVYILHWRCIDVWCSETKKKPFDCVLDGVMMIVGLYNEN